MDKNKVMEAAVAYQEGEESSKKSSGPKYIPLADLIEYRKKKLSYDDIGKLVGCSGQNVQQRMADLDIEGFENFRKSKDTEYELLQHKILKSVDSTSIEKTPFVQRVTALAILEDKIRLIQGKSTANNINLDLFADDLLKARKVGHAPTNSTENVIDAEPIE